MVSNLEIVSEGTSIHLFQDGVEIHNIAAFELCAKPQMCPLLTVHIYAPELSVKLDNVQIIAKKLHP